MSPKETFTCMRIRMMERCWCSGETPRRDGDSVKAHNIYHCFVFNSRGFRNLVHATYNNKRYEFDVMCHMCQSAFKSICRIKNMSQHKIDFTISEQPNLTTAAVSESRLNLQTRAVWKPTSELAVLYPQDRSSTASFMIQVGRSTVNFPKHAILSSVFVSPGPHLSEVNNNNFTAGIHNKHQIFTRPEAVGLCLCSGRKAVVCMSDHLQGPPGKRRLNSQITCHVWNVMGLESDLDRTVNVIRQFFAAVLWVTRHLSGVGFNINRINQRMQRLLTETGQTKEKEPFFELW